MITIDGKQVAEEISSELKQAIDLLKAKNIIPTLVIIQVGDVPASNVYVKNKIRLSERLGAKTNLEKLPESTSTNELLKLIQKYNNDKNINGILVQMPLPKHIDETKIIETIDSYKDVDCFKLDNVGKL
jgi:methylenetetrahydrofolate dehydrogenase (NADP+)/methenyltetrahydrofolate cyclohydrolase